MSYRPDQPKVSISLVFCSSTYYVYSSLFTSYSNSSKVNRHADSIDKLYVTNNVDINVNYSLLHKLI